MCLLICYVSLTKCGFQYMSLDKYSFILNLILDMNVCNIKIEPTHLTFGIHVHFNNWFAKKIKKNFSTSIALQQSFGNPVGMLVLLYGKLILHVKHLFWIANHPFYIKGNVL